MVWLGTAHVSRKIKIFLLPEEESFAEVIKERISNRLKEYSKWIKKYMRKEILNYYYFLDHYPWLCDKSIIFQ